MSEFLNRDQITRWAVITGCLVAILPSLMMAKEKTVSIDPNDPTLRLFQYLDTNKAGKLTEFYVVADVYKDPAAPNEENQRILKVDYDKSKMFGKLQIVVRSVGKIQPDQMKAYTPKDFFGYGLSDQAKYIKSEPGPLGKPGDMYLQSMPDRPLSSVPVTDEIRMTYERLITEYLLPALDKK
jgi:hypothetical protein